MKTKTLYLTIVMLLLASAPGQTQVQPTNIELIAHLEEAQRDCEWKTRNLTGGPKGKMLLHKKTMDDVLEQLKAGQTVDPRKIEKALEVHGS